jgi:hypothetical protein
MHDLRSRPDVGSLLHRLQATVQTLDQSLQQIQAAVARERSQLPQVVCR